MLDRLLESRTRFPPFTLFRAMHLLCSRLALEENAAIDDALTRGFDAILHCIPDSYLFSSDEFVAEYERWDRDSDGYRIEGPSIPLHDALTHVGEVITD